MAYDSISVKLDNSVQSGDQSVEQIKLAIAQSLGLTAGVADPVRDANGKLVSLKMRFPDTVSASALEKIAANAGVLDSAFCSPRLMLDNLNAAAPAGMVLGAALGGSELWSMELYNEVDQLGRLEQGPGVGAGAYTDAGATASAYNVRLRLVNSDISNALTWAPTTTLTLNFANGSSLAVAPENTLVLGAAVAGISDPSRMWMYVSDQGKLYLNYKIESGTAPTTPLSYDDACLAGAL